jgi:hypothetical protein
MEVRDAKITFCIAADDRRALEAVALRDDRSVSSVVRIAVRRLLNDEKTNP